jgi:SagB-type dehydrogenase family enzyme
VTPSPDRPDDRTAAILAYHEATKHSPESIRQRPHFLDWDNRPFPFKVYLGLDQFPLPADVPSDNVPALEAIATTDVDEPAPGLDLEAIVRLLVRGAGVHHTVTYANGQVFHFRNYASAGALYPVEVYVACAETPDLPAGVYHFQPRDPALTRLRDGDYRGHLVRATASEPAVVAAPAVLVLTGIPWRTAWKYTERGYRHLFWDAGMILANLLGLAACARLPGRVVLGFADAEVGALFGLEERREFPLCLVAVGVGGEVNAAEAPPGEVAFKVAPLSHKELVHEGILQANDTGRVNSPDDVGGGRCDAGAEPTPKFRPASDGAPTDSLVEVIRRRGSARLFEKGPVPAGVLVDILARATVGISTDYAPAGSQLVEAYLIANALEDSPSGAYVFRDSELALLRAGNFRNEAWFLCLEQGLGATAAATIFLMADLRRTIGALGPRGYRAAQLEAGVVAGRIYLGAYAYRFGATGLTFYDDSVTEFFHPDAEGKSCMLVVAVGESPRIREP